MEIVDNEHALFLQEVENIRIMEAHGALAPEMVTTGDFLAINTL